jgi:tRNA(Arg) A34 adenosine deaminase TadA
MSNYLERQQFMRLALEAAQESVQSDRGGPFGACIVRDGQVLAVAGNRVLESHDPTAHAEVGAIRAACAALGTHHLEGAHIYSTTEPCPMCFSAIHWARIGSISYGTSIEDVAKLGFNELPVSNQQLIELGQSPLNLEKDFMRDECFELLQFWESHERRTY